jgi:hypothetical protein
MPARPVLAIQHQASEGASRSFLNYRRETAKGEYYARTREKRKSKQFVFAYDVLGDRAPLPAEELFACRGNVYGFIAVPLSDYAAHAHPISPRWNTWAMPSA